MMFDDGNPRTQNIHESTDIDDDLDLFNYDDDQDEEGAVDDTNQIPSESRRQRYRHFSTSICSFFHDPSDCCSFVFCGVLQSDRTYFLLNRKRPPQSSISYRLFTYLFVPYLLLLFGAVTSKIVTNANYSDDDNARTQALSYTLMGFFPLFAYIVFHMHWIHDWRVKLRTSILKRAVRYDRAEIQREEGSESVSMGAAINSEENLTLDPSELAMIRKNRPFLIQSHQICCGCYPRDDRGENANPIPIKRQDFCTQIWNFFASLCCGACCGCWCQCCGVCALAQEAREVKRLISNEDQMIDYITFEVRESLLYCFATAFAIYHYIDSFSHLHMMSKFFKFPSRHKSLIQTTFTKSITFEQD